MIDLAKVERLGWGENGAERLLICARSSALLHVAAGARGINAVPSHLPCDHPQLDGLHHHHGDCQPGRSVGGAGTG